MENVTKCLDGLNKNSMRERKFIFMAGFCALPPRNLVIYVSVLLFFANKRYILLHFCYQMVVHMK